MAKLDLIPEARIKPKEYMVIAPRFIATPEDLLSRIQTQNPSLPLSSARLLKPRNKNSTATPLLIGVSEPHLANLLCENGLLFESEFYDCEIFFSEAKAKRCYKCQQYTNHVAKHCTSQERCGNCGSTHSTKSCTSSTRYCVPCKKLGHSAFSTECRTWAMKVSEAKEAFSSRPTRFQIPRNTESATPTLSSSDGWQEISRKRPRQKSQQVNS
jgi:hypothetical protein